MSNIIKNTLYGALTLVVVASLAVIAFSSLQGTSVGASVIEGQEYNATTTYGAHPQGERTLKTGAGSLGSVIITGDNTGLITFYNATTSDVNLRTGNTATSAITVADFPASSPEGTYTFDAVFTTGLLMVTTGTPATSTVTWR